MDSQLALFPELKDAEQTLGNEMPSGDVDLCIGQ